MFRAFILPFLDADRACAHTIHRSMRQNQKHGRSLIPIWRPGNALQAVVGHITLTVSLGAHVECNQTLLKRRGSVSDSLMEMYHGLCVSMITCRQTSVARLSTIRHHYITKLGLAVIHLLVLLIKLDCAWLNIGTSCRSFGLSYREEVAKRSSESAKSKLRTRLA